MGSVLLVLQLIVAIFLVVVILMQRSSGGALSGLGGDSNGGLLSVRGKGNILTRTTAVLATLFFGLSMALSIYFSRMEVKTSSIIDNAVVDSQLPINEDAQAAEAAEALETPEVPTPSEALPDAQPAPAPVAEAPISVPVPEPTANAPLVNAQDAEPTVPTAE